MIAAWLSLSHPVGSRWGGSNAVGNAAGATAVIPFTGTRAVLMAVQDYNLGLMDVYLDGDLVKTVDLYAPSKTAAQAVYGSGSIAPGDHTLKLVTTGQKSPQLVGIYADWETLFTH